MTGTETRRTTSKPKNTEPKKLRVDLGARSYDILVSFGWLQQLGEILKANNLFRANVMVFTSPRVGGLYYSIVEKSLRDAGFQKIVRHNIKDGEENKNMEQYGICLEKLAEHFPDPGSTPLVINLGGGVVGDLGGFAAGTFNRGLSYVQIPTTLLGDVDCGVGGKVGVNFQNIKNIVGMFHQPSLVFTDLALLKTLDAREIRSGTAEVIKYSFVCDAALNAYLDKHLEDLISLKPAVLSHVVYECYRIKVSVVEQDEKDDKGQRIVLNFGHTIGHALEMAAHYKMTHGEAISVGMVAATMIAIEVGVCAPDVLEKLKGLLTRAGLPISAVKWNVSAAEIMQNMQHDKKFSDGRNRFVLPTAVGDWVEQRGVDNSLIRRVVDAVIS